MPIIMDGVNTKGVIRADGTLERGDTDIRRWYTFGVPSLHGVRYAEGERIVEEPTRCEPDDLLFGMAMMEECERQGWDFLPDETPAPYMPLVMAKSARIGAELGASIYGGDAADMAAGAETLANMLVFGVNRRLKAYDETKHRRKPKGDPKGGEYADKPGATQGGKQGMTYADLARMSFGQVVKKLLMPSAGESMTDSFGRERRSGVGIGDNSVEIYSRMWTHAVEKAKEEGKQLPQAVLDDYAKFEKRETSDDWKNMLKAEQGRYSRLAHKRAYGGKAGAKK